MAVVCKSLEGPATVLTTTPGFNDFTVLLVLLDPAVDSGCNVIFWVVKMSENKMTHTEHWHWHEPLQQLAIYDHLNYSWAWSSLSHSIFGIHLICIIVEDQDKTTLNYSCYFNPPGNGCMLLDTADLLWILIMHQHYMFAVIEMLVGGKLMLNSFHI